MSMDDSERLVESYLKNLGFTDVRYEPDGNVPPDFLADDRVAVEVRRLNQNYDDGSGKGMRGLEDAKIALWRRVRDYLIGLGPDPATGQSWYVYYSFSRPIPSWNELKKELDFLLLPFMAHANPEPFEMNLNVRADFRIKIFRAPTPKRTFFLPAGYTDQQSGGWLIDEVYRNLNHCIAEKSAKIQKIRTKYPEWWLVLSDQIGYGLDDFERDLFSDQVQIDPKDFDKIVLLDPRDAARVFQIYP